MKLSEIKEMLQFISPYPWRCIDSHIEYEKIILTKEGLMPHRHIDFKFIAAAPQIIAELVGKLETAVETLRLYGTGKLDARDAGLARDVLKEIEK